MQHNDRTLADGQAGLAQAGGGVVVRQERDRVAHFTLHPAPHSPCSNHRLTSVVNGPNHLKVRRERDRVAHRRRPELRGPIGFSLQLPSANPPLPALRSALCPLSPSSPSSSHCAPLPAARHCREGGAFSPCCACACVCVCVCVCWPSPLCLLCALRSALLALLALLVLTVCALRPRRACSWTGRSSRASWSARPSTPQSM